MSKAAMKRHAAFRKKVTDKLLSFGGKVVVDDHHTLQIEVDTKRIGLLEFTMFKNDGEHERKGDGIYSIFCKLPTEKQVKEHAPWVNLVFGYGIIHVMNPFTGKWNIHYYSSEDALKELDERMAVLNKDREDVHSKLPTAP